MCSGIRQKHLPSLKLKNIPGILPKTVRTEVKCIRMAMEKTKLLFSDYMIYIYIYGTPKASTDKLLELFRKLVEVTREKFNVRKAIVFQHIRSN